MRHLPPKPSAQLEEHAQRDQAAVPCDGRGGPVASVLQSQLPGLGGACGSWRGWLAEAAAGVAVGGWAAEVVGGADGVCPQAGLVEHLGAVLRGVAQRQVPHVLHEVPVAAAPAGHVMRVRQRAARQGAGRLGAGAHVRQRGGPEGARPRLDAPPRHHELRAAGGGEAGRGVAQLRQRVPQRVAQHGALPPGPRPEQGAPLRRALAACGQPASHKLT